MRLNVPAACRQDTCHTSKETTALDRGLGVTWYDLSEQGCDVYLAWLHGTYIP